MWTAKSLPLGTPCPLEGEQYSKLGEMLEKLFKDHLEPSAFHQKTGDLFFTKSILGDSAMGSGGRKAEHSWMLAESGSSSFPQLSSQDTGS